jgi:hypothetical protein
VSEKPIPAIAANGGDNHKVDGSLRGVTAMKTTDEDR